MKNTKQTCEAKTELKKSDYWLYKFIGGYYGIVHWETRECIFGGDSANHDDYNEVYMSDVYNNWDGSPF